MMGRLMLSHRPSPSGIVTAGDFVVKVIGRFYVQNNVADPADPAFQVSSDPIPDSGLDDQNWIKKYSWKKIILFLSKIAIYLSTLGLHKGRPRLRRRIWHSKEDIEQLKNEMCYFFYFCGNFCPPGSRSRDPIESVSVQSGSVSVILVQKVPGR